MERRKITEIILHCSASGPTTTIKDLKRWHKERGWEDIGYHIVIEYDGNIKHGRDINKPGAHCKGHNEDSIGVCLIGGHDGKRLHKFSKEQVEALELVLDGIQLSYGKLPIYGHYKFANKICPNFDVDVYLETGKIEYKTI